MKDLRVTTIVKEIKLEGVWGELEPKLGFQRQSFPKYLRLTLVFTWNSALREKFSFYFSRFVARIDKIIFYTRRLHTRVSFDEVYTLSWYFLISEHCKSYVVRHLMRQLVYTIFISNNCASSNLWWKDNLVKHQQVSKYYENDFLLNLPLLFMSLFIGKFVEKSQI